VGQNAYTARWFDGKLLAFAFGLIVAFSRIGSAVNFFVTPLFAVIGVPFSVWFGATMCMISFVSCIFVALLDWYGEARVEARKAKQSGGAPDEDFRPSAILKFPATAWIVFLQCMIFYISVLTFYTVASDIMQKTGLKYAPTIASQFLAIPNFVAIPASPIFGILIDRYGRSCFWMLLACAMQVVGQTCFLLLAFGYLNFNGAPIVIMAWIGLAYSMFAASIWPTLPFIIRDNELGTGYGIMTSIQNAGLALFPLAIGKIQDALVGSDWKYYIPCIIFICCAGLALLLDLVLMVVDFAQTGGILNKSGAERQKFRDELNKRTVGAETQPLLDGTATNNT